MRHPARCASLLAKALLTGFTSGCAAEPLVFPGWTIPVPEGTRIVECAGVPIEERAERIELVEELVIGNEEDDPNYALYRPTDIVVGPAGRIFVFDSGNSRVQVFDRNGTYLRTIGREGSGPGEIDGGGSITIADGKFLLTDGTKLSVWSLEGEHLHDSVFRPARSDVAVLSGFADGSLVAQYGETNEDRTMTSNVVKLSAEAQEIGQYVRLINRRMTRVLASSAGITIVSPPDSAPTAKVSATGDLYVTNGDEYQVLALDSDASPRWALRTTWTRMPLIDEDKEKAVLRRVDDSVNANDLDVDWPELMPALANGGGGLVGDHALQVDGHGHLYVFPFVRESENPQRPVDVYSPEGALLFAGFIPVPSWMDAVGDSIYRFEEDERTEELQVVRYRLVEPFESRLPSSPAATLCAR